MARDIETDWVGEPQIDKALVIVKQSRSNFDKVEAMTLRIEFKETGQFPVCLELRNKDGWNEICNLEMCALEDNDLARLVPESNSFEPIIYLRCKDLSDAVTSQMQQDLAVGQNLYCRLKSALPVVSEGFHFKVLRIREIYKCPLFIEDKEGKSGGRQFFKYRWMITGIAADTELLPT